MPGIAGELQSSMSAIQFLEKFETAALVAGAVIYGFLADRFGRKPLLLAAAGMMVAGVLLYPFSASVLHYGAGRFIATAGAAGMTVILTLLAAEYAREDKRAFVIVLVGASSIVGMMAGSTLAGAILDAPARDWRLIFYTFAGITLAGLAVAWRLLPESSDWRQAASVAGNAVPGVKLVARELGHHWPLLAAYFLMALVVYALVRGMIPALADRPSDMGRLLSWVTFGSLSGSVLLLGLLWKFPARLLTRYILALSAVVTLIASISPFFTTTQPLVLFSVSLFCNAGLAVLRALMIVELPVGVRGAGSGVLVVLIQTANPLASSAGPWMMNSSTGLVALKVLMVLACLGGVWLVKRYLKKL